jgi:hypothetical protein
MRCGSYQRRCVLKVGHEEPQPSGPGDRRTPSPGARRSLGADDVLAVRAGYDPRRAGRAGERGLADGPAGAVEAEEGGVGRKHRVFGHDGLIRADEGGGKVANAESRG